MAGRKVRNDEKHEAMRAAKELGYGPKVVEQIRQAKTSFEIGKILKTARDKMEDY